MSDNQAADAAKARWAIIQVVRLTGVAMVLFGVLIMAGRINLPQIAGMVLALVGLVESLALPLVLAKAWKTPDA
ncbi:MAG: hypothetical protein KGL44_11950 [Sphingomonadales bacterium]|nr:hypothetical protein [Sphingomonadales bacterium]